MLSRQLQAMAAPLLVGADAPDAEGYDATAFKYRQEATVLEGRESYRQRYPREVMRYEACGRRSFDDTAPRLRFVLARPAELRGEVCESMFIN